ncbi:MAG: hypothetical protein ACKO96_03365, partial [Flammeovirgaceae bacterium]
MEEYAQHVGGSIVGHTGAITLGANLEEEAGEIQPQGGKLWIMKVTGIRGKGPGDQEKRDDACRPHPKYRRPAKAVRRGHYTSYRER